MEEIKVGQRYWVRPAFGTLQNSEDKEQVGTVVWVHPEKRYAVLEFQGVYGNPRESFMPGDLTRKVSARRGK